MADISNTLKCKFCLWQTKRWITTKKGKKRNRSDLLIGHVMIEHPEEFEKIQEAIVNDQDQAELFQKHRAELKYIAKGLRSLCIPR